MSELPIFERTADVRIKELEAEVERLQRIEKAARGLACGVDWNNGTHASIYRPELLQALAATEAWRSQMTLNIEEIHKAVDNIETGILCNHITVRKCYTRMRGLVQQLIDRVEKLEGVISKSVEYLEASEAPFYNGIKELKEAKSDE